MAAGCSPPTWRTTTARGGGRPRYRTCRPPRPRRAGSSPRAGLDKAWRLLASGAHHDGITGVESDQVYLDLLGGWREAWELGSGARRDAVAFLSGSGQAGSGEPAQAGRPVRVFNGLARPRAQMATVTVPVPEDRTRRVERRDDAGQPVPALSEGVRRRGGRAPAEGAAPLPGP